MHRNLFVAISLLSLISSASAQSPHPDSGESSAWSARIRGDIEREEYVYSALVDEPGVWSAPNRSQDLRTRVSRAGLEVFPRQTGANGVGAAWRLVLRTASFGRVGSERELDAASASMRGNRIELDHGLLTEWFVNDERGIEQGWTIAERPRGVDPLWIGLEFRGELALRVEAGGRSAVLVDPCGEATLRYRDLVVFDASGRELDAQITSSPDGVGIRIDDTNASYPVTVDPLLTGPAWTAESDQADAWFGRTVATAGDVNGDGYSDVVVAANFYDGGETDEGRAYVYLGSSSGVSTTPAWTAESDQAGAFFGHSLSTAGDVNGDGYSDVIIGAYEFDNGEAGEGRVFVYLGSAAGLAASPAWTAESDQSGANFGVSVAGAGDVNGDGYSDVIVGAYDFDNGETNEGRAYVFAGSAAGLSSSPVWTAESDQVGAWFGFTVSTGGDVNADGYGDVMVGAIRFDNGQSDEGRAYVYAGSSSGLSTTPVWTAECDQAGAHFSRSLSTAGDVNGDGYADVIVGADLFANGETQEGRAFAYLGSAAGLAASPAWTAESDHVSAVFGQSVSTAGDVNGDGYSDVIVGAIGFTNGETSEGRAFVYTGSAAGLSTSATWTAESNQAFASLGSSVAGAGDVNGDGYSDVIVGAVVFDNGETNEGRAFVYHGSALGLAASSGWTAESDQSTAAYGYSVATAGDVNGDGFSDVIVGAYLFDNGQADEGRAFVYLGSATGLSATVAWTAESDQAIARFGVSVGAAGDVNGDGYSDVIVGADLYDNGRTDEGRAFVYLGSATGLSASVAWSAESNQAGAWFGHSVATAGDVNGDGYSDVIVGAYQFDNGQTDEGRAFVYLGSATGLSAGVAWTAESAQAGAWFGVSVASAGDVNGDGYSDVIVGAYLFDNGESAEGRASVYHGSATGLSATAAWTAESDQAEAFFGLSVATAGDVNGDGYSDVIVGAPFYDNGETTEGRAFVYHGSATGLSATVGWTAESDQASAQFGWSVASAGDVNGDGYSDVIAGAFGYDNGQTNEGRAFVYHGSATGLGATLASTAESDQAGAQFGYSVATAGDVNGDGYSDVIVSAPFYGNGESDEGRAFVYYGNEGRGGWTLAPQQRRSNDAAPIDLLGRSLDKNEFRIKLGFERELSGFNWASGLTPKARLEWEIAPLRVPLDGSRIAQGAEQTITGSPLTFNELVEFVAPGPFQIPLGIAHHVAAGAYHWRVRLRTNNPVFPVTPWTTMAWNNVTETKLRVGKLPASRTSH
jgi:hypothetical protein